MLAMFLGAVDIFAAALALSFPMEIEVAFWLKVAIPLLLFFKALPFSVNGDIISVVDIFLSLLLISAIFFWSLPSEIFYAAALFLGLKGFLSFL